MGKNWYLKNQAEFVAGSAQFSSMITAGASTYGLTSAQATAFAALNVTLQSAYATAVSPTTGTKAATQGKNVAMRAVRAAAMNLSDIVRSSASVDDEELVALGLLPRHGPGPQPIPTTAPVLEVIAVMGRLAKLRIHQANGEASRKPVGVAGAQIFSYVGNSAPTDPRAYHYEGLATRGTCDVLFPDTVASGATVWFSAAWVTVRGYPCLASTPIQVTLQGGPVAAAA